MFWERQAVVYSIDNRRALVGYLVLQLLRDGHYNSGVGIGLLGSDYNAVSVVRIKAINDTYIAAGLDSELVLSYAVRHKRNNRFEVANLIVAKG